MAGRILLAEDDRALSALIRDFFSAAGLEVVPAFDGAAALALAREESFDLLILDVMMPHFSGLEVCRAVREESAVPILFITALGQEGDALAGYRAGAADYIVKPFWPRPRRCSAAAGARGWGPTSWPTAAFSWTPSWGRCGWTTSPSICGLRSTRSWSCCCGSRAER